VTDLDKAARIKLIRKALEHCGQPVTQKAIARQYYIETKEHLGGSEPPRGKLPAEEK